MSVGDHSLNTIAIDLLLGPVRRSQFGAALSVPPFPVGALARNGLATGGQGEGL